MLVNMKLEFVSAAKDDANTISTFLRLGRDYFKDLTLKEHERFIPATISKTELP